MRLDRAFRLGDLLATDVSRRWALCQAGEESNVATLVQVRQECKQHGDSRIVQTLGVCGVEWSVRVRACECS